MLTRREARAEGKRAGHAAATWFEPSDELVQMIEDGDPEADQYMPRRPDLSGEYAGESMNELLDVTEDDDPDDVDEIADIWQEAADAAYQKEIDRAIRAYVGPRRRRQTRPGAGQRPRFNPGGRGPRIVTHGRRR
jgi:hypothetical protein